MGLSLVGCGGDDDPSCPAGSVLREGKCYAVCDEAIDCKGSARPQKCVATAARPEGACLNTCTASTECASGEICEAATSIKGEAVQACKARTTPAGKLNDACAKADDCDAATGLTCSEGKCKQAAGTACAGDSCAAGLACFQGSCVTAAGGPGEGCDDVRGCDAAQNLVCYGGTCVGAKAAIGEECSADRACDDAEGLVCLDGACRYGCQTVNGCAAGYECKALPEAQGELRGACVKSTLEAGPGQYGTSCPKGIADCDKEAGFVCIGAKGDINAFCAKKDGCADDSECPSGYWCGAVTNRDAKGNVDFEAPIKVCLQREFCSPCETDLDCSHTLGAVCVPDADGEKFCSTPCDPKKKSCLIGASCSDVGDGVFACRPNVGYCHNKGAPSGCDPCRIDSDCGDNAVCASGEIGNKSGLKWCHPRCGEPDADGKRPCPVAPNGVEMVCLDENLYSLGGPFTADDTELPGYFYGTCFRPFTVDNSGSYTKDAPVNVCGNGKREEGEECDDGNPFASDGCDKCKIVPSCRFTLETVDGVSVLKQNGSKVDEITCFSFLVEGTIQDGAPAQFRFDLDNGSYAWFEAFAGGQGQCSADLVATVQTGDYDAKTDTVDITDKDGKLTPCEKLTSTIKNLDAATPSLCPGNSLGCGSCTDKGLCGVCDDDSGLGNCPRMLLSSTTDYQGYKVKFASTKQVARIYPRDQKSTVPFVVVVDRLTADLQGPKNPPALSCY